MKSSPFFVLEVVQFFSSKDPSIPVKNTGFVVKYAAILFIE